MDNQTIDTLDLLHKPLAGDVPISGVIDKLVHEGELYETLPDNAVHCFACGHHCKIKLNKRGICQVRYNLDGKLYVPWGYAAALNCDPTEKKPFFHVLPGSQTMTFGMLGCDLHCSYCFPGETTVIAEDGPLTISKLFYGIKAVQQKLDAEIAYPKDLRVVSASGRLRRVKAVFKHPYRGKLASIKPYYLPTLRCTPDHRVYATRSPEDLPQLIPAQHLTPEHYLGIPRHFEFSSPQVIDAMEELGKHQITYRVPWKLSVEQRQGVAAATVDGQTSRQIDETLGKSASYIRHVRSKLARGRGLDYRTGGLMLEGERVRFPNEHKPGLPRKIALDKNMARLLGFYCSEGSVVSSKKRPNSLVLNFSFSPKESIQAQEVRRLLKKCLDVEAQYVYRETTLALSVSKASAALLLKSLAGKKASEKRVPKMLFNAPRPIVQTFLDAMVEGDGHRYPNGKISITTVSPELAYGISWLVLKSGHLPSIYRTPRTRQGKILGRTVTQSPYQFSIVWYENTTIVQKVIETENYFLIPLREITFEDYEGEVFNMEVEVEHNYLAGFFAVSNCQNWDISQALRDANAGHAPSQISPERMVELTLKYGAQCIASSYNEPLITSEWAMSIFKHARSANITCLYVSNGNATPEVLQYIRPHTQGYKVDLKTMNDKNYRKLGAVLQNILDSIRTAWEMGFWVEIVTLIVPGFNDSEEEMRQAAKFIKSVSPDIPWHITAFYPTYKMLDPENTQPRTLIRAAEIGCEEGLHYVYAGNLPGRVNRFENTYCPNCQKTLVKRTGYHIHYSLVTPEGTCPHCQTGIAGIWVKD